MTGYSGTPLAKKLGIQEGARVIVRNAPMPYESFFERVPDGVKISPRIHKDALFIHAFFKKYSALQRQFPKLKKALSKQGILWISWPKKTSSICCDFTENDLRDLGLRSGLVDVKVAAIDTHWSGLKFVYRLIDRPLATKVLQNKRRFPRIQKKVDQPVVKREL